MIEVRRMPRNTTAGFERVPNAAIRNAELSLAAVGLLARLLTDGERYDSIDALADAYSQVEEGAKRKHGRGRDTYRKAALELEAAGHLVRVEQKAAGNRTRPLVRAVPEKGQVGAATESPSWERRAETNKSAGHPRDGKSVAGMNWGNDAYEHVGAGTESPSRHSPAEANLSARQSRDGLSVPDYIQTSSQTTDLLLHSVNQGGSNSDGQGEQEEVDAGAFEPHPDALTVIAAVDLGGKPLVPKSRAKAERILTTKLAEGWTVPSLNKAFEGCADGAYNPPGAFMSRVQGLGAPPVRAPIRASPKCPDCDGRGLIEDDYGNPTPCPSCKPPRSTP